MTDRANPLHVVAAVIIEGDSVLVARRLPGGSHGGAWEFPGGKVEKGETPQEALARELMEELGVAAAVGDPLVKVLHAYPHRTILLDTYLCRILEGEATPIGCAEVRRVSPAGLFSLSMPEADRAVLEAILDLTSLRGSTDP